VPTSVTYTAVLDVRQSTAEHLARLLRDHRVEVGTRRGRRALGRFRQAVLVPRWCIDGTRVCQLARDNGPSTSTAYRYPHEGLAAGAPDLATALERAKAAGPDPSQPGRHGHPHRPRRGPGPGRRGPVVVREAQAPRRQRAGHLHPGRLADLGLAGAARPRARHHPRPPPRPVIDQPPRRPAGHPHPGRPRLRERRTRLPPPSQETRRRRAHRSPADPQQGHPRHPRSLRARERPTQDHLQGAAAGQAFPLT
jgi:hypothetical protein